MGYTNNDETEATYVTSGHADIKGRLSINSNGGDVANGGAIPLDTHSTIFSTGGSETSTLAAGTEGQIKVLAMKVDGGDMVVTVTNPAWKSSGTGTITFDDNGDSCILQYLDGKWYCLAKNEAETDN
tara:strand:+ start:82 stop:462 length:381 start_codon:yes stop_codon:yes gene_type:complete